MKKVFVIVVILLFFIGFAACGNSDKEDKNIDKIETTAATEEKAEHEIKEVNYKIVDNKKIKATLIDIKKFHHEVYGNAIDVRFEITNKDKKELTVQAGDVSADGETLDKSTIIMSRDIPAGEKGEAILTIMEFEDSKLPALEKNFEMILNVFSWEDLDFEQNHKFNVQL